MRALPWLAAVLGGAAWGLCFGVAPRPLLPWVALVPLAWLATARPAGRRRALLIGWLHGFVHWLVAVPWIVTTIAALGGWPWLLLGLLALALMSLILGFFHALFVVAGQRLAARRPQLAPVLLPSLWVVLEWARGHLPSVAFPWNLAAYAWAAVPGALPLTAWIGSHGLSWLLASANVGLALALRRRRPTLAAAAVLLPLLFLAVAGRFSWGEGQEGEEREVVVIQPDATLGGDGAQIWQDYRRLIELSAAACDAATRDGHGDGPLLVWPESAAFPLVWGHSPQLAADVMRLASRGCKVLLNTPLEAPEGTYNGVLLITSDGVAGRYAKRRLVPWGEYVPLGDLMPFVGTLARISSPFRPGTELGLMPWGEERLGLAVCYEVTFPELVAEQVRAGATVLVTVTNDAWYGDTAAPWQHFRAARFRAAENRRPLVRAALTGVSGLIDARGRVVARLGVGERDVLAGRLRGSRELTPYARAPWLVPLGCALLLVFAIIPRRRAW